MIAGTKGAYRSNRKCERASTTAESTGRGLVAIARAKKAGAHSFHSGTGSHENTRQESLHAKDDFDSRQVRLVPFARNARSRPVERSTAVWTGVHEQCLDATQQQPAHGLESAGNQAGAGYGELAVFRLSVFSSGR